MIIYIFTLCMFTTKMDDFFATCSQNVLIFLTSSGFPVVTVLISPKSNLNLLILEKSYQYTTLSVCCVKGIFKNTSPIAHPCTCPLSATHHTAYFCYITGFYFMRSCLYFKWLKNNFQFSIPRRTFYLY